MAKALITVTLCWSWTARQVHEQVLRVPEGCTVQEALDAWLSAGVPGLAAVDLAKLPFMQPGIWGHKAAWHAQLVDGDRIELYRGLQVDPKVARRQRFKRQGKGRTGLFANRKSGVAAGY
jgi:putative ubiquitin-RnfH superfamily antitoxin RatB of RatAB toxin-antitoxin module